MTYLAKAKSLYAMIGQGQMLDAFEKFYHEEVVMQEATGEIRKGKATNLEFEKKWLSGIETFHGGGVNSVSSNEDDGVTSVESWTDVTFKNGRRAKLEEVAIQKWQDGLIIHERFYYNVPDM